MTTMVLPTREIPRPEDLGPDPEPAAPRLGLLLERERRARHLAVAPVAASRSVAPSRRAA